MTGRVPDAEELAEDLNEIKKRLEDLLVELKSGYVPRELYEARHTALRSEIALEMAAMKRDQQASTEFAAGARTLAMWCLGVLASAVVVACVGFLVNAAGGAA